MSFDERGKYKSWSDLKKQMNDLLCDSLKDSISYFYTSYHEAHNSYGRATINYNRKEMVVFSWVQMHEQEREAVERWRKGECASYDELYDKLEEEKWMPEGTLSEIDFILSVAAYLKTDVFSALHSSNYLFRVFAFMDRRVGKRTLIKIKDEAERLPAWVRQFYRIRWEAEGLISAAE